MVSAPAPDMTSVRKNISQNIRDQETVAHTDTLGDRDLTRACDSNITTASVLAVSRVPDAGLSLCISVKPHKNPVKQV